MFVIVELLYGTWGKRERMRKVLDIRMYIESC
jgi:hypothetical protein